MPDPGPLDPEDAKLVTLARATRARVAAAEGAAVRDDTGRSYAAATVSLPSLSLPALHAAVVLALASGARGLEAAVVVGDGSGNPDDLGPVRDLGGAGRPVHYADASGRVTHTEVT
jgi:hypothetical protein